jgi:hypothetical protein
MHVNRPTNENLNMRRAPKSSLLSCVHAQDSYLVSRVRMANLKFRRGPVTGVKGAIALAG